MPLGNVFFSDDFQPSFGIPWVPMPSAEELATWPQDKLAEYLAFREQRNAQAIDQIGYEKRNNFFRKLMRAVIVRAPGRNCVESMGPEVGANNQVARCFACRVWGVGEQWLLLVPRTCFDGTVNLVCRDMKEAFYPVAQCCVEQDLCSKNIRFNKDRGIKNGPVDVGFGGKMNHQVRPANGLVNLHSVPDIALNDGEALVSEPLGEVGEGTRIGQCVENNDLATRKIGVTVLK